MPEDRVVAANGLLDRRLFLRGGAGTALALSGISSGAAAGSETLRVEHWKGCRVRRSPVTASPLASRTRSSTWRPIRPTHREPVPPARRCIY
jgi:hypothetical protein